jgi:hypothetical protein
MDQLIYQSKEYKENWVLISISTRHKKSVKT